MTALAERLLFAVRGPHGLEPYGRPEPWLYGKLVDAESKAEHLNKFDNTNQYQVVRVTLSWVPPA